MWVDYSGLTREEVLFELYKNMFSREQIAEQNLKLDDFRRFVYETARRPVYKMTDGVVETNGYGVPVIDTTAAPEYDFRDYVTVRNVTMRFGINLTNQESFESCYYDRLYPTARASTIIADYKRAKAAGLESPLQDATLSSSLPPSVAPTPVPTPVPPTDRKSAFAPIGRRLSGLMFSARSAASPFSDVSSSSPVSPASPTRDLTPAVPPMSPINLGEGGGIRKKLSNLFS